MFPAKIIVLSDLDNAHSASRKAKINNMEIIVTSSAKITTHCVTNGGGGELPSSTLRSFDKCLHLVEVSHRILGKNSGLFF